MNRIYDEESLQDMTGLEPSEFEQHLEELVDAGFVETEIDVDDNVFYRAKRGLYWPKMVSIDCPPKKQILLCLIENPKTFFVLYNTQKGKLKIAAKEIRQWVTAEDKKVVAFVVVDNEKQLADQSEEGIQKVVAGIGKTYLLSSNTNNNLDSLKNVIDVYAGFGGPMPIILALNNSTQINKIIQLMKHIQMRSTTTSICKGLCYGVVFDEADKVYPPNRSKFEDVLLTNDTALHRLGFVTATEGQLLEAEYPECANAYMYPVPVEDPNYRAIHTEDADIKIVVHRAKDDNDAYAELILQSNKDHFKDKTTLNDGSDGYRKTIVNGGGKCKSMEGFAKRRIEEDTYAITLNMQGVWVYRKGYEKKRFTTKGVELRALLFKIYKDLGLHDKPLYIIGRRKVDRGLGFHWAPPDGSEGLIWTDMILGRIDDKDQGSQKAGRLGGIVAHCPQYPGKLTWWTDAKTAALVVHHNKVVDCANTKLGCSALQAVVRARVDIEFVPPKKVANYKISSMKFTTPKHAKRYWKSPEALVNDPHDMDSITAYGIHNQPEGKCIKYRGDFMKIVSETYMRNPANVDFGQGANTAARVMPVMTTEQVIEWVIIYKPNAKAEKEANAKKKEKKTGSPATDETFSIASGDTNHQEATLPEA